MSVGGDVYADNLVKYAGNLGMGGHDITTTRDLVVFGQGYDVDDAEVPGADTLFAYDNAERTSGSFAAILADPNAALLGFARGGGNITGLRDVWVGANFYVNGGSLSPSGGSWNLHLLTDNGDSNASFAEVYRCTINNGIAMGAGWVAGGEIPLAANHPGCMGNWDFARPAFLAGTAGNPAGGTVTVYDNLIRVSIDDSALPVDLFENTHNEISTAVSAMFAYDGTVNTAFTGTFTDPDCNAATHSTDGKGDIAVFYLRAPFTWNTDASGTGAGAADSTDRSGTHRAAIPRIVIQKATAALFQTLRDSHKNRIVNYPAGTPFTAVADACRPVLATVEAGQAAHANARNPVAYDGHNFLQLRYSEPVAIGNLTLASAGVTAEDSFAVAGAHGGEISQAGANQAFAGYLSYPGTVSKGSRDATSQINSLYRAAPNAYGANGLYISVGGRSTAPGLDRFWWGYFTALTTPVGSTPTVPYNAFIADANGCALEPTNDSAPPAGYAANYPKTVGAIAASGSGWDVTRPLISYVPDVYDVVPYTSSFQIERIEFRLDESIRDSSFGLSAAPAFPTIPSNAFTLTDRDELPLNYRTLDTNFDTTVSSAYLGSHTAVSDEHFSIQAPVAYTSWTAKTQFYFRYDSSIGRLTDSAGNLLGDYDDSTPLPAGPKNCVEALPPKVRLTSAVVGGSRLYLQFSEPVYQDTDDDGMPDAAALAPGDFVFTSAGLSATAVQELSWGVTTHPGYTPAVEVMLTLSRAVTADDVLNFRMTARHIADRFTNQIVVTATHRVSDFGLGLIETLSASDGVHSGDDEAIGAHSLGALRTFDGTGRLYDRNISVNSRLEASVPSSLPVEMYFDVAPSSASLLAPSITMADGSKASLPVWIPGSNSDLFDQPNSGARLAPAVSASGQNRSFLIPSGDAEVVSGNQVEFLYRVSDLYCLRSSDANDPRRMDLFRLGIQDISMQRGGVTILNNVIDPTLGEHSAIQVDLTASGYLTVQVFTLDGDVVRVLSRTPSAAGTFYFTWDGRNAAGRAVARGLYFIRVVGPGMDEIRKVMIVKRK